MDMILFNNLLRDCFLSFRKRRSKGFLLNKSVRRRGRWQRSRGSGRRRLRRPPGEKENHSELRKVKSSTI